MATKTLTTTSGHFDDCLQQKRAVRYVYPTLDESVRKLSQRLSDNLEEQAKEILNEYVHAQKRTAEISRSRKGRHTSVTKPAHDYSDRYAWTKNARGGWTQRCRHCYVPFSLGIGGGGCDRPDEETKRRRAAEFDEAVAEAMEVEYPGSVPKPPPRTGAPEPMRTGTSALACDWVTRQWKPGWGR